MPWLTIIVTLLSFFASKKSGNSNTKSALIAGLAGAGTYFVSHETEWGREYLGDIDGVDPDARPKPVSDNDPAGNNPNTKPPTGADGKPISAGTNIWDVFKGWGAGGTAAVVGTGAAAAGGLFDNPLLLWGGIAIVAIALLK